MKEQIAKALTTLGVVGMLMVTVAPAAAQAFNTIRVDVPFDFNDGDRVFPAGKYTIRPIGENGVAGILIRSEDGKANGIRLCNAAEASSPKDETALVFHRYGDQYFLSQVWITGDTIGLQLPKSSMERGVERAVESYNRQSASNSGPAIVTIAASLP